MTETRKPLILVTNDDGYHAKGIQSLVDSLKGLGEIVVFSPDKSQSGMSSAITVSTALRCRLVKQEEDLKAYICTGTPVDCVKLALNEFLDRKPDLVVSGINHGSNAGISVLYSGTVGAAIEGCVFQVPSIAVSLCEFQPDSDFSKAGEIARKIAQRVLIEGLPSGICLNVNVPAGNVKGIKITSQTQGKWVNEYFKSKDGSGRDVFWMTGDFENWEEDNDNSDEWALANGYAAVVPVKIDMTAHDFIPELKKWQW
jgi:5'-nucleotidase